MTCPAIFGPRFGRHIGIRAVPATRIRSSGLNQELPLRSPLARPNNEQEIMKKLTVLAAALAAGLTTFAANALKEDSAAGFHDGSPKPAARNRRDARQSGTKLRDRLDKTEQGAVETQRRRRRLTAEEVLDRQPRLTKPEQPLQSHHRALRVGATAFRVSLAHAVISVESNYRPDARGRAGEVGLMQIKPATARMMGYCGSTQGPVRSRDQHQVRDEVSRQGAAARRRHDLRHDPEIQCRPCRQAHEPGVARPIAAR